MCRQSLRYRYIESKGRRVHIDFDTIGLQFFALYLEDEGDTSAAVKECSGYFEHYRTLLGRYDSKLHPILSTGDLRKIGGGIVGSLLAMENSEPLAEDSEALCPAMNRGSVPSGLSGATLILLEVGSIRRPG